MIPMNQLTSDSILSDDVLTEVFAQEDELYKSRLLLSLEDRAGELGVKRKFQELVKAYKRIDRETRRQQKEQGRHPATLENWTNFKGPYDRMQCKQWIASEDGIYLNNPSTGYTDVLACYHPILPIERMRNLETGEEKIKLAYKRKGIWYEIIVPKTMAASASKIVQLSGRGVSVTSENAKFLVRYLADVENANDDYIDVQYSSGKLGWIGKGFLPYDTDIIFDGNDQFKEMFESIRETGSRTVWYEHIKKLRKRGRLEVKFSLAAAFASVLLKPLNALPFIVDLWGATEGGKSITMSVAASVWADPAEHKYIGDLKGSEVGLEVCADMLNNLPMMLDDTSKVSDRISDNFESIVYDLCSGKGKTRSNKDLGLNRQNRWQNIIMTNGEKPLDSYVKQGGAINRILELECGATAIYQDPQETVEVILRNYGFAGKDFVDVIKQIGTEHIREIQEEFQNQLYDDDKMQKQSIALSIILTADKIATDEIFHDGIYISIDEAKEVLVDRKELSDNERCYQYIMGEVAINSAKFMPESVTSETWGTFEGAYVVIFNNVIDNMCRKGGFSKKAFLSWADRKGLIKTQGGQPTRVKKVNGHSYRCVYLLMDEDNAKGTDFVPIADTGSDQIELPFPV